MTAQAYPLQWPQGRPRKPASKRKGGRFTTNRSGRQVEITVYDATTRLLLEIERIGGRHLVISTNLEVRQDGLPRSNQRDPADPGVCVYFSLAGKPRAMPCDTYDKVAANIAAIAAHVEATRAIERHGVATVAEMFEGFAALPAPGAKRPWWEVLGVPPDSSRGEAYKAYLTKAKTAHPDAGGSTEAMAELNRARDEAMNG